MTVEPGTEESTTMRRLTPAIVVLLVVAALFAGVLLGKARNSTSPGSDRAPAGTDAGAGAALPAGLTITSVHNDALADYEAALKTGKPIYVLFHSLTCQPCVEISAVVDSVMPGYEGRVVFVNAISDDPSGRQLASKFQFQYIPTSFFISSDGTIADSFTGSMNDADMKARLDTLIVQ